MYVIIKKEEVHINSTPLPSTTNCKYLIDSSFSLNSIAHAYQECISTYNINPQKYQIIFSKVLRW